MFGDVNSQKYYFLMEFEPARDIRPLTATTSIYYAFQVGTTGTDWQGVYYINTSGSAMDASVDMGSYTMTNEQYTSGSGTTDNAGDFKGVIYINPYKVSIWKEEAGESTDDGSYLRFEGGRKVVGFYSDESSVKTPFEFTISGAQMSAVAALSAAVSLALTMTF